MGRERPRPVSSERAVERPADRADRADRVERPGEGVEDQFADRAPRPERVAGSTSPDRFAARRPESETAARPSSIEAPETTALHLGAPRIAASEPSNGHDRSDSIASPSVEIASAGFASAAHARELEPARSGAPARHGPDGDDAAIERGATAPQLRRFIKSRAYVPMHELRRRFAINGGDDEVTVVDLEQQRVYVGLPEREGHLLGELLRGGDIGYELSMDPISPIVVGVYPMRPVTRA
jgi:hypothetical protein